MASRANDSEAISGGRSPPSNQATNTNPGQTSGSTTHQTISTQVYIDTHTFFPWSVEIINRIVGKYHPINP